MNFCKPDHKRLTFGIGGVLWRIVVQASGRLAMSRAQIWVLSRHMLPYYSNPIK